MKIINNVIVSNSGASTDVNYVEYIDTRGVFFFT